VVESGALLKRCTPKGYPGFESLPHRWFRPNPHNSGDLPEGGLLFDGEAWRILTNQKERKAPFF
jgi:hypothetical protein